MRAGDWQGEQGGEDRQGASGRDVETERCVWLMDHFHLKHKNKAACQSSLGQFH